MDPNVKRALWRVGAIMLALIFGGIGSALSHSIGPMVAAGSFSLIMLVFAILAGTGNHRAAKVLMIGLGGVIVANEVDKAVKRHEDLQQQSW